MQGWIDTTLGNEFNIVMGQSPASEYYNDRGQGIPFFQGKKEFGELYPKVEVWTTQATKKADKGDVLLSVRAPIGDVNIASEHCGIGRGLAAIKPNDKTCSKFIFYLIKANENELKKRGAGVTFSAITKPNLFSLPIKVPQDRKLRDEVVLTIETQLTRLDAAIKSLRMVQTKLELYRKSVLKDAFNGHKLTNCEIKGLGDFERKGGGTPSTKIKEYWGGDIDWITSASIDDRNKITYEKKITELGLKNSAANLVPKKSVIVVTRVGLGKVAVNEKPTAFSQDSQGIICDGINPYFLMWQIKSAANEIIQQGQGTTISGITVNKLNSIKVKVPDLDTQAEIVGQIESRLSVIDHLEKVVEGSLRKSEVLRKCILKSAFEGKLIN